MTLRGARDTTWRRLVWFDEKVLLAVRRAESQWATGLMRQLTRLGDASTWIVVGLALSTVGGARYFWLLGLGAGLAVLFSQVLKRLCRRERPHVGVAGFSALAEIPDAFSFPSGHTAAACAAATALAGQGTGLAILVSLLALGIAISRVYLGAHYPLDVMAGAVLGLATGLAARVLVERLPLFQFAAETAWALSASPPV